MDILQKESRTSNYPARLVVILISQLGIRVHTVQIFESLI